MTFTSDVFFGGGGIARLPLNTPVYSMYYTLRQSISATGKKTRFFAFTLYFLATVWLHFDNLGLLLRNGLLYYDNVSVMCRIDNRLITVNMVAVRREK